ncbi:hypothetical protein OEZ85_010987 [Tetradesmus obliquus]|uniref:Arp2/3 complex 34 kDa subunit n=1 Tax=Tetradesmus obliquus TaxID=3088 RepID=A0ABY8TPC2_TETOB|nr:hypothetical protein OEZ85_010987 [Tetradesmus obliquus]
MAQDVAHRIFEMACSQRASEAEQRRAASKRLIRFELHASVELPADEAEVEEFEETVRVQIEARAPGIVLHSQPTAQPGSSHHWHLEYEGMQYDITEFPQGVSFVLRCVVDTLLSRFSEELIDKDQQQQQQQVPSGVRPWTHTFGRLFFFPNTLEASYEAAMQRYILALGKHVVAAAQAVRMICPRGGAPPPR